MSAPSFSWNDCFGQVDWCLLVVRLSDGRVVEANAAARKRFPDAVAGRDWAEPLGFADLGAARAWLAAPAKRNQPWQARASAGGRWWRVRAHALADSGHALLAIEEVTAAAEAAERQRLEGEHFHALIERSAEGISIFDVQAKILYESPANKRIHGYESAEMEGRNLFDFCHPDDMARVMPRFASLAKGPGIVETDIVRFRHKAGHYIYLEGTVLNATDDPRVNGLVNNFRDVTGRIEAERELRRAKEAAEEMQRRQQHFLANLSHEFKTPLTLIRGPLTSLADGRAGDGRQPEVLALVLRNVDRLDALLTELIDLARLEAGTFALRARQLDMVDFARRLLGDFSGLAQERKIVLRLEAPPECVAFFDPAKIEKVLGNFLSNALRFSPAGTMVHVGLAVHPDLEEPQRGHVEVTVRDEGPGMDAAIAARVFERFYQGQAGNARGHEGLGIGLAIAREMVEMHGGRVRVQSRPGHGSAFSFSLPLGCEHLDPDDMDVTTVPEPRPLAVGAGPRAASGTTPAEPGSRPRLLLVEDNADMRTYLRMHLDPFYAVTEATNGREALDLIEGALPGIVLADVMMPQMDGLELCRRLRADPSWRKLPVLLLSAKASADHRVEGLQAGADDYLTKPFAMAELLQRLKARCSWDHAGKDVDQQWQDALHACMDANLGSSDFDVEALAKRMGMSSRQLRRRVLGLFDQVPAALLLGRRLQKAHALMLARQYGTLSETAHAVGLSPGYLSRRYRQAYGAVRA